MTEPSYEQGYKDGESSRNSDMSALRDEELRPALERIASLQELLQIARGALADIGVSSDMTLTMARKKAKRIYIDTEP